MTESTLDMLTDHVINEFDRVQEFADQIESGDYGMPNYDVFDEDGDVLWSGIASDEDDAYDAYTKDAGIYLPRADVEIGEPHYGSFDEPTLVDENGNYTPISEWPLDIVVKIGRPLAVLIAAGGPHIKIEQDLGNGSARLAGYCGGEKVYRHGDACQTVFDYLTDGLFDQEPD